MFSLYGFYGSVASTTPAAYAHIAPIADPIATVSGNLLYVGALNNLIGGYVLGQYNAFSKIVTPSLLNIAPFQIAPPDRAATPSAAPAQNTLQPASPRKLVTNEAMEMFVASDTGRDTVLTTGLVFLSDGALAPVDGDIIHARATFTSVATAHTWQNASLTFDTVLPAGTYQLVGARVEGAHVQAYRFVFQGNTSVRPGGIAANGVGGDDLSVFRNGKLGVWGTFDQFTPPSIDHIDDGTSETCTVYLDLIKSA